VDQESFPSGFTLTPSVHLFVPSKSI